MSTSPLAGVADVENELLRWVDRHHRVVLGQLTVQDVVGNHPEHQHRVLRRAEGRGITEVEIDEIVGVQSTASSGRDDVDPLVDARAAGALSAEDATVRGEVKHQVHRLSAGVVAGMVAAVGASGVESQVAQGPP